MLSEVTFPAGVAREDNTDVPQSSAIVAFRLRTRLRAKQAPRGELESAVHVQVHYTTIECKEFATSFK